MAGRYASATSVSPERSRIEIERTLRRYGADGFAYAWDAGTAQIGFRFQGRSIRFSITLPERDEFVRTPTGRPRAKAAIDQALAQAERQRWRALAMVIQAKLEAVSAGITTIEDEFLAWTVLSDGRTVAEWVQPQISAPEGGPDLPALLLPSHT